MRVSVLLRELRLDDLESGDKKLYAYDSRPFFAAVRYVTEMLVSSMIHVDSICTYFQTSSLPSKDAVGVLVETCASITRI